MTTVDQVQPAVFRCVVITIFPDSLNMLIDAGITGRAHDQGLWQLFTLNPRDYAVGKHRRVDDRPYGGGPGMVMQAPPLRKSIQAAYKLLQNPNAPVIYMSPQGERFSQTMATSFIAEPGSDYIVLCGRYEGVDERLLEKYVDREISIGDYVLSGGEIPAMAILDAIVRLIPGACGHQQSVVEDSFVTNTLDHAQYTRPEIFEGQSVPSVLLSGDHKAIKAWRQNNEVERTKSRRPDLI